MALLHEGVSLHKPLLSRFKETIRAVADMSTLDLAVEEALMLGVTRSANQLREAFKRLINRMTNTNSFSRLLLKALIAFKSLSSSSPSLNDASTALIKTEKCVAEMKRFTKNNFNKYEADLRPFYNGYKLRFVVIIRTKAILQLFSQLNPSLIKGPDKEEKA